MKTRILLVDDHRIFRQALRAMLAKHSDIEVVGEADNGLAAVKMVSELLPDIIIMDIAMPDMNGIEATREIIGKASYEVKVICLTMHSDAWYVTEMLKAGASAFLLKDCAYDELIEAITAAKEGRIYLSQSTRDNLMTDYINTLKGDSPPIISTLTPRELEVLQQIAEGHSTKEIASSFGLSTKTIETHRQNIMEKLKINNIPELVKFAIREGLTSI